MLDTAKPYWQDLQTSHARANAASKQSKFPASREQLNHRAQISLVSDNLTKPTMVVSNENMDSPANMYVTSGVQQTNAAETSLSVTQILSTGQKTKVDVLFVFCFLAKRMVEILVFSHIIKFIVFISSYG